MTLHLVNPKFGQRDPELHDAWKELHSSMNLALVEFPTPTMVGAASTTRCRGVPLLITR
jgi:hypothetical protein